jgi:predicted permease
LESVINVVLPVFGIILAGYLAGVFGVLGEASSEAINRFVFYVAMPVLLFHSLAGVETARIVNGPFLAAYGGGQAITLVLALAFAKAAHRARLADASLYAFTAIFANTGYLGIPLAALAFGEAGVLPAIVATAFQSAVFVAVAAALVETDLGKGAGAAAVARHVALAVAHNPLFVAPVAGMAWSLLGLALPAPVDAFCRFLGSAAGPSALFAIGLFLVGKPFARSAKEVASLSAFKLFVQPLVTALLALALIEVEPPWAKMAVVLAALPAGANCFVLATHYGIAVERTSAAILATTAGGVVTLAALLGGWGGASGR